jgi:hypothetical protein
MTDVATTGGVAGWQPAPRWADVKVEAETEARTGSEAVITRLSRYPVRPLARAAYRTADKLATRNRRTSADRSLAADTGDNKTRLKIPLTSAAVTG